MSIIADPIEISTVEGWCAEVQRLHDEFAQPITEIEDPRITEVELAIQATEIYPRLQLSFFDRELKENPRAAGATYFRRCVKLPTTPIDGPAWAESHDADVQWPDVNFDFATDEIIVGDVAAIAKQTLSIQVAADEDAPAGTLRSYTDGVADVTLLIEGHPIDFYAASTRTLKNAAAALTRVAALIETGANQ